MIFANLSICTEYLAACAWWPVWGLFNRYFYIFEYFAVLHHESTPDSDLRQRCHTKQLINEGPCVFIDLVNEKTFGRVIEVLKALSAILDL